ncbi:MAG TPA: hypothetical protein VK593_02910 [Edaphobacter sp.]|nr:hypothetical protein [Edaphobacter sp.]
MDKNALFGLMPLLLMGITITPQQNLIRLLDIEKSEHSLLTYSQHYLDKENDEVEYTGTIYFQIESFVLDHCTLTVNVLVQDRYSGAETKKRHAQEIKSLLPLRSFTYRYAYQIDLSKLEGMRAEPVEARPYQLLGNTGFACRENTACHLQWLRLEASGPMIREKRELDGLLDFNQPVKDIAIPIASHDSATQIAKTFDQLTATCHVPTSNER